MFSFLRRLGPVAAPENYEAAHVAWLLGTIAGALRLAPGSLVTADGHDTEAVLRAIDRRGLEATRVTLTEWLDEAKTPRDAKVLVLGGGLSLVLGRKDDNVLLASPGDASPQVQSVEALADRLRSAQLFVVKTKENMEESYGWRWFLSSFFSRKTVIRDALIASLVIQLVGLAYPLATQAIVDKVITNQAQSTLIALGVGIALFAVFNALMGWLRQKLLLRLANVVDVDLSNKVIAHLFRLPLRYFEARSTGLLVTRAQGVERVREFASGAFLLVALELPFMLIFLGLMLSYSLELSGVVLSFVAVMVGLSFACGPHLRTLANKQFEAGAKVQGFLTERVAAHETVKSLQLEVDTVGRFSDLNRKKLDTALAMREFGNGYITFMQLGEQLMGAAVLCLGAYLAMTGPGLTIGMLVAFQMFAQRVSQPLLKVAGTWQELQQVRTAVSQLGDVMSTPAEQYSLVATSAGQVKGSLAIQGLGFRHSPDRPPLYQDLNFEVKPGQVALVTGPSGCGKSTLAKVMQGLYRGHDGFVRLDGRDTRSMPVNELRNRFGVVPQETVLFSGTILDNVMAGGHANMEQVVQACKMAGIHETIENMPMGYQSEVGERGTGLSGGQRQRIGIARALLKRPSVLIFDEATSGLDDASAEHIGQTVNFLRGKVTVLFVAHKVPRCLQVDSHIQLHGPAKAEVRVAA